MARCRSLRSKLVTNAQRLANLFLAHGWLAQHVARAASHFVVQQTGNRIEIRIHSNVDHMQRNVMLPRQHIDGCTFRKKVENHLPRHFAGIGADSLLRDSMVGGKDIYGFAHGVTELLPANGGNLGCDIFETAQAPERLSQSIEALTRPPSTLLARRLDIVNKFFHDNLAHFRLHDSPPKFSLIPDRKVNGSPG